MLTLCRTLMGHPQLVAISDRVLVMGYGSIVFEGTPQDLRADACVRKEWLEV